MEKPLRSRSPPLPEGGEVGQVLKKTESGVEWADDAVGVTAQQLENQRVSLQNQINAISNNLVGSSGYRVINGTLVCWGNPVAAYNRIVNFPRAFSEIPAVVVNNYGNGTDTGYVSAGGITTTKFVYTGYSSRYIAIGPA